jgi:hypothetical protein
MLKRLALVAASAACALLGAAVPDAGATWTAPLAISPAGVVAGEPQIAVDGAGNATAVWVSGSSPSRSIRSAFRPAGGPWEAPSTRISEGSDCHDLQLAVNPAGGAVVVADCGTGTATMRAAYRSAGGSWASSVAVPESGSGEEPRVALDGSGNAVMVWEQSGGTVQSSYRPAAGSWGGKEQVSPAPTGTDVALEPQVAISATGAALAIWLHELNRSPTDPVVTVESTIRHGGAAWSGTPKVLTFATSTTTPVAAGEPQISLNANGQRTAVWANFQTPGLARLEGHWGDGGDFGAWSETASIRTASDGVRSVETPQVGLDGQGRAVAVWHSYESGVGVFGIEVSTTAFLNGPWSSPVVLAEDETGFSKPDVAVDPAGAANAVWVALGGTISAASGSAGGAFAPATPISNSAHIGFGDPQIAMDTGGDAIAAWPASGPTGSHIAVAVNDVTPPVLSAIGVPSTVAVGTTAAMTATASDAWSSPVSLAWDFGDGATVGGNAVSHAYATPGTKTVTVTATDAAGNSAGQTRQIAVTQTPSDPGLQPGPSRVTLGVTIPKQPWKTIAKAKEIKLRCTLDAIGACKATASVSGAVAKRLGLKLPRRGKALPVGSGTTQIAQAGRATKLKVQLKSKVLTAIAKAKQDVLLALAITGSAAGRASTTLNRKFTIQR